MNSEEGKRPNEPLLKRLQLTQACSGVFREAFYEGAPAHLVIFGIIISRAPSPPFLVGWLASRVLRGVGGVASSVMSPRPRIGLIHQRESLPLDRV